MASPITQMTDELQEKRDVECFCERQASKNVSRRQSQLTNNNDQLTGALSALSPVDNAQAVENKRVGPRPSDYLCIRTLGNNAQAHDKEELVIPKRSEESKEYRKRQKCIYKQVSPFLNPRGVTAL